MPNFDKTVNEVITHLAMNVGLCTIKVVGKHSNPKRSYLIYVESLSQPIMLQRKTGTCTILTPDGVKKVSLSFLLGWVKGNNVPVPFLPPFKSLLGGHNEL